MSAVCPPYVSRISAVYPPYVSRLSAVCQPYISAVCQPWSSRMSAVYQPYVSRMSAVCQPYIRRMSAIPNLPICHYEYYNLKIFSHLKSNFFDWIKKETRQVASYYKYNEVFRRGYRPQTINFPCNIRMLQRLSLLLGLSGETQIRALLRVLQFFQPISVKNSKSRQVQYFLIRIREKKLF